MAKRLRENRPMMRGESENEMAERAMQPHPRKKLQKKHKRMRERKHQGGY